MRNKDSDHPRRRFHFKRKKPNPTSLCQRGLMIKPQGSQELKSRLGPSPLSAPPLTEGSRAMPRTRVCTPPQGGCQPSQDPGGSSWEPLGTSPLWPKEWTIMAQARLPRHRGCVQGPSRVHFTHPPTHLPAPGLPSST